MMDPSVLAKSGSEHAHQRAYFQWLLTWNNFAWEHTFAIPNGGARASDQKTAMIRGGILKAEGVKAGVPDIMCAVPLPSRASATGGQPPYAGLFIEMKKMQGGVVGSKQSDWRVRLAARGYKVVTCYNWQEAANATAKYFGQATPFNGVSNGG